MDGLRSPTRISSMGDPKDLPKTDGPRATWKWHVHIIWIGGVINILYKSTPDTYLYIYAYVCICIYIYVEICIHMSKCFREGKLVLCLNQINGFWLPPREHMPRITTQNQTPLEHDAFSWHSRSEGSPLVP